MGVSGKPKADEGLDSQGQKWVLAVISIRAPLKPIYTSGPLKTNNDEQGDDSCSTTPTGEDAKIQTSLTCPPAPRKPKPSFKCSYGRSVREFFTPPDLESAFICHVERESSS
ncbi:hypothetical protein Gotri_008117 [Gossypium trilobum]|uniref:Cyclin-dependent protein kinase inhibitor SMR6 n=1 Tax=Gossypium trilobum TaxID=34281 RepID=A0A7J9EJZ0_9ROSI|nr:hypothetical protein [Gossypium trilobum]